jgi:ribosomal protein L40E
MAETEPIVPMKIARCIACGYDNDVRATECARCGARLRSEVECLRMIDASLRTIKRIAIWWLILSILSVLAGLVWFGMTH